MANSIIMPALRAFKTKPRIFNKRMVLRHNTNPQIKPRRGDIVIAIMQNKTFNPVGVVLL